MEGQEEVEKVLPSLKTQYIVGRTKYKTIIDNT